MELSPSMPSDDDLDATLDRLIDLGIVSESDDGGLSTTSAFEDVRAIYHDTYANAGDEMFHRTVADAFGVDVDDAAEYIDANDVTREELVAYLSVRSYLADETDADVDAVTVAHMASLVREIGPGSPVPPALTELDDDTYEAFLESNPDAVLTVWKHHCAPCEALKTDLDDVLDAVPEGVAVAGLDGESVGQFRLAFGVDAAPAMLLFRDGELRDQWTGRLSVESIGDRLDAVYGTE